MIRALLDGRKHQTRRILTRNNASVLGHSWRGKSCPWEGLRFAEAVVRDKSPMTGNPDAHLAVPFCHPADEPTASDECGIYAVRPVIEIGDRLYVRETFSFDHSWTGTKPREVIPAAPVHYWADGNPSDGDWTKPIPAIHQPRWASRLTLTVTDVRVQRLQEITPADAIAEGIEDVTREVAPSDKSLRFWKRYRDGAWNSYVDCPIGSYASLWTQINGAGAWDANPWVCAISFEVHRRNIDEVAK
jgi:hypothetical protein